MSVSTRGPRAPRPRAPAHEAETRREEILEAALEVMSRRGFERASIAAIAGRARVARATVYQHFCDKQDILVALAERITRRIIEAVNGWAPLPISPFAGAQELRAMIETRVGQIFKAITDNADATRLVVRLSRSEERHFAHELFRKMDDHVIAVLSAEIEAATSYRWARSCDARTAARFILGGIDKIATDAIEREDTRELENPELEKEIGALVFFALAHHDLLSASAPS